MVIREAIPTSFNGVRYDSKSEAIFAYLLKEYEQDYREITYHGFHSFMKGGHPWDFFLFEQQRLQVLSDDLRVDNTYANIRPCYIELKPRKPTKTYFNNLREKFLSIEHITPKSGLLIWGGPWTKNDYGTLEYMFSDLSDEGSFDCPDFLYDRWDGWLDVEKYDQALSYRYDLA